ncbi:MAG: hypothetical protein KJ955_06870 [Nanoarchaeota archaeon]|nr:hypothetical protein [Nanoarchaeota archaeon]
MTLEQKVEERKPKGRIRRLLDWIEFKRIERQFKALSELGPKTLEVIKNEWQNIPYRITHLDSKHTPWRLRFTGIELPQYDKTYGGPHNAAVRMLFTHLLVRQLDWNYGSAPGDFNGLDGTNKSETAQVPGCRVESLSDGNIVARKTIDSYLAYKSKIDMAIQEIERIYEVEPLTHKSRKLGLGIVPTLERTENYPSPRDLIPRFREEFGLDYLTEKLV